MANSSIWSLELLRQHSVDIRQFVDFRQSTLPNGMRMIEAYNASGLSFSLLPDRGLDIWSAHYKGIPLTWISQGSPHPPDFGQTWLQQFNGGLLTTCGLTHVGPPETDEKTGMFRDLHGRYSRLHAENIAVNYTMSEMFIGAELTGAVSEHALFGDQLRLERKYVLSLDRPTITIEDKVRNLSDTPAPLMVLYHFNVGYPMVSEGVRLVTPYEHVYPRDAEAKAGFATWDQYSAASRSYAEQVFFHRVKSMEDNAQILLYKDQLGLALQWNTQELPYFTQWKNTRQGIYVSGIEPGNCIPEGQNAARKAGRLQMIQPGEEKTFWLYLSIVEGAEAIERRIQLITHLQSNGTPVENCLLEDYRE